MLDANLNRAREALRVLEDIARFELDHRPLCEGLKHARHELAEISRPLPGGALALAAARDTPGDVGTTNKTTSELTRTSLHDLALASAKRLTEALRAIEEALKLVAPSSGTDAPAARAERLRYQAYELEKRLVLALGTVKARQWRLCVLITQRLCLLPWEEVASRAIQGGADCLQLREKDLPARELLARAKSLVQIARAAQPASAAVVINDRPDIALLAGAQGVHLGQDDLPVEAVRRLAGDALLVGVSTHDLTEAHRAAQDGADYTGVGAMFTTATKHRETSGPDYLRAYMAEPALARVPHLAIGGITPSNLSELVNAGCRGVAVSAAVCAASDPAEVCRQIVRGLARRSGGPAGG